jgi:hypothetical protein
MLKDLTEFPFYKNIVLQVKKDTNDNTVAFVWNGTSVEPHWILKDDGGYSTKPFSFVERSLAGVAMHEDSDGRLQISFTFPIGLHKTLYFVSMPNSDRDFAVVFKNDDDKLCKLEEVFVLMNSGTCLCRCRVINGTEFVESFKVDFGPIRSFL